VSIARFSVRQGVMVNLLFFVCVLAGLLAYVRTPVDFFPDISFNVAVVTTVWTGASADEVERLVTSEIEDEIDGIDGIKDLWSQSNSSLSTIAVQWEETLSKTEQEFALNDLRAALDRVSDLPDDAEEPFLRELSVSEVFPSILISVTDVGGVGEQSLRQTAREVEQRLEAIPGVEKVSNRSEHERELRVMIDRDLAARHALTVTEVAGAIERTNLNLPAGTFSSESGETTLRATGDYTSLDQVLATVVKRTEDGSLVRLSEIARLEDGIEKRRFKGRYNGRPAMILGIAKQADADIIDIAGRVDAWIEQEASFLPAGIEVRKTMDTSRYVSSRMRVLSNNLITGVFLVMAILWFTVGFRNAALTIIAIPFSFLVALILFPIMGLTISALSLVGMLLVSGMLVDDAIIVLENIYRRIEEGEPLRDAVIKGTEEVMWPVIAAVATTAAAFAPLLLISGTSGEYFAILPKAVIVCLVASLFECLVILPAHYLDFGSRRSPGELPERPEGAGPVRLFFFGVSFAAARLHRRVDLGLGRLRRAYVASLDVVLAHKGPFAALTLSCWLFSCSAGTWLPIDLFPSEFDTFFLTLEAPTEYSIDQTDRVTRGVEQEVMEDLVGDVATDYSTYVGALVGGNHEQRVAPNLSMIYVTLTDTEEHRLYPERALRVVREKVERYREKHPEGTEELRAQTPRNGPPIGRPVATRIQSDDYALSKSISLEMQAFLRTLPGVYNIEDSMPEGPREIRVVLDEERAHRHGLSFRDLTRSQGHLGHSAGRGPHPGRLPGPHRRHRQLGGDERATDARTPRRTAHRDGLRGRRRRVRDLDQRESGTRGRVRRRIAAVSGGLGRLRRRVRADEPGVRRHGRDPADRARPHLHDSRRRVPELRAARGGDHGRALLRRRHGLRPPRARPHPEHAPALRVHRARRRGRERLARDGALHQRGPRAGHAAARGGADLRCAAPAPDPAHHLDDRTRTASHGARPRGRLEELRTVRDRGSLRAELRDGGDTVLRPALLHHLDREPRAGSLRAREARNLAPRGHAAARHLKLTFAPIDL
jgi:HAE1 family hydrophobic/amphiphilic exporter-1